MRLAIYLTTEFTFYANCLTLLEFSTDMTEVKFSDFMCSYNCIWPSKRIPVNSSEEQQKDYQFIIEAYQPTLPKKQQFIFPQHHLSDHQAMRDAPFNPAITSQPQAPEKVARRQSFSQSRQSRQSTVEQYYLSEMDPPPRPNIITPTGSVKNERASNGLTQNEALLDFNVYYDTFRESLNVHVHRALHLPPRGLEVASSFIKTFLLPCEEQVLSTKVVSHSLSPAYDELLEFSGLSLQDLWQQTLVLQVYYHKRTKDEYVCCCSVKLKNINLTESNYLTRKLSICVHPNIY